jgi:hypothetical protein
MSVHKVQNSSTYQNSDASEKFFLCKKAWFTSEKHLVYTANVDLNKYTTVTTVFFWFKRVLCEIFVVVVDGGIGLLIYNVYLV